MDCFQYTCCCGRLWKNVLPPNPRVGKLRITSKLAPASRGTLKLAAHCGDALVCVRHRCDEAGQYRFTTVELVVDGAPVRPRSEAIVDLRIGPTERHLQALLRTAGAPWDYQAKLWSVSRRLLVSRSRSIALWRRSSTMWQRHLSALVSSGVRSHNTPLHLTDCIHLASVRPCSPFFRPKTSLLGLTT